MAELFSDPVVIEEKIDGSQFSFGLINGVLSIRSKGKAILLDAPDKMFTAGVNAVIDRQHLLKPGYTYRGEYLSKPKHNALVYTRIPFDHIAVFDIDRGLEDYLSPIEKATEAARLSLEVVPCFAEGIADPTSVLGYLGRRSFLGGVDIEGVVVKNYHRFGSDKKILLGKVVSPEFTEAHKVSWSESHPGTKDIIASLGDAYRTEARWDKAIQHLRDEGRLVNAPQDIGLLIREVWPDIERDSRDEIKEVLYRWAEPHLKRQVIRGLPEYYKARLEKTTND